jgi:hypothetical protein
MDDAMDERAFLDDWLATLGELTHAEVASLSHDELAWRPDPLANSVGLTVWHYARWLDVLACRVLADRPAEAEVWQVAGWAARTGYDPRGIGYLGLGVVTGYTAEEAAAVPNLPAEVLLAYFDAALLALRERLRALPAEAIHAPAPGLGSSRTAYERLKAIMIGCFGHVGEIAALNAMRGRAVDSGSH